VLIGAMAVWNASPAGANEVVAQASPAPVMSPAAKPAAASPSPSPSPSPTPTPVPHAFSISGYGDLGYTSVSNASNANTNSGPLADPNGRGITGRVFDADNQVLQFHNFNIQAAYLPQAGFGAKLEYSFGEDADLIHSYPQSLQNPATEIDLTQGYASYVGGPLSVIVGKFETLAGAEVIEAPSDLNISRSILFGYAVPFTHTGGRITYAVNGDLNIIVGANQGWDTTKALRGPIYDPVTGTADSSALTAEYGLAWTPSKIFSLTAQGYSGQVEEAYANVGAGPPVRTLTDFVATYHYNSAFTIILNGDIASQNRTDVFDRMGNDLGIGTVSWDGAALYLSYNRGLFTLTGRGEYFADNGGSRTYTGYAGATYAATRDLAEGTGTLQYQPNSNLIFRAEYRYDTSTNQYFASGDSIPTFNNGGFGLEAIVKWP
jgi:hypothetical protein